MFTIGDFASLGRVSVRMLRHYDAIGLLRPARVDPTTGYRHYRAGQLAQLNRIVALKELGFSLQQVKTILQDRVTADELRGMLRLRRVELEAVMADARARLAEVESRLRTIESESRMPTEPVVIKSLPPLRVAELTATSGSFDPREIGPVVTSLFDDLRTRLDAAGVAAVGPGVTRYEDIQHTGGVAVHAGLPVAEDVEVDGVGMVELAGVERAATIVHCGPMDGILPTVQVLARWLDENGSRLTARHSREVSIARPDDPAEWVTELQVPTVA
ncbi:MerR family transcriptional regulator [Actinomycetes bacterium KLBMP 9759]